MRIPLYIHIPFCRKKCNYCDFYSIEYNHKLATRFIAVLKDQIRRLKSEGFSFITVYIGGGTPSVLDEELLKSLLKSLELGKVKEVTLEANPESLTEKKLSLLLNLGVNRLSIGVQSFNDDILRFLGRAHDSRQALKSVSLAKRLGFKNLSLDLIYGIPSTNWRLFKKDLDVALKLPITHISIYSLTYEKSTPLYRQLKDKRFYPLSEEEDAAIYSSSIRLLKNKGFKHYEVSNFAKKGFQSLHNLYYWKNFSYLGLGPSAVSYLNNLRKKYTPDIYKYLKQALSPDSKGLFIEKERLSELRRAKETAALNIRRSKGINFSQFKKDTGFEFLKIEAKALEGLKRNKLITFKRRGTLSYGIRLTRKGFLFCDRVCAEFV